MQTMRPKINDAVQLIDEIPGESLAKGAIGAIVEEFSEPEEAYEVEFCDVVSLLLKYVGSDTN